MKLTVEQIKTLESQGVLQDWKHLLLSLASQEALNSYESAVESAESNYDSVKDKAGEAHENYLAPYKAIYDNAKRQADSAYFKTTGPAFDAMQSAKESAFQAILDSL